MISTVKVAHAWTVAERAGSGLAELTVEHPMPWPPTRQVWTEVERIVREQLQQAEGAPFESFSILAITPIAAAPEAPAAGPTDALDIRAEPAP